VIQDGWIKLLSNAAPLDLETKRSVPVLDLGTIQHFFQGAAFTIVVLFGVAALLYLISLFRLSSFFGRLFERKKKSAPAPAPETPTIAPNPLAAAPVAATETAPTPEKSDPAVAATTTPPSAAATEEPEEDSVLNEKTEVLVREAAGLNIAEPPSPPSPAPAPAVSASERPAPLQAAPPDTGSTSNLAPPENPLPDELSNEQTVILSSPVEEEKAVASESAIEEEFVAPPPPPPIEEEFIPPPPASEDEGMFGDEKTEILDVKTKSPDTEKASAPVSNQELPSAKPSAQNAPQMASKNDSLFKIDEDIEAALNRDYDATEEIPIFDPAKMDEALESEINNPTDRGRE